MRPLVVCIVVTCIMVLALVGNTFAAQAPVAAAASGAPATAPAKLPIRRVVLYKNGVGYFEHVGKVRGNQELSINFTSSQLNDVLKSLTVVDLGEGRVTGVRYDSTAPLAERMKTLRLGVGEQTTQAGFLDALRGARVDVRSGTISATGKILAVEARQRTNKDGVSTEVSELSIITDAGEMRTFELGPATSVRVVDRDLHDDVGRYLDLIGSSRSRDLRRMVISTSGTGERDLFIGYISEVPVWKSTYRILLPEKAGGKARLQGWAIVDNTVGEDWEGVQLALVAGAPQSFIQEISRPYYTRRPVVPLPESVLMEPQQHQATMGDRDRLETFAKLMKPPPAASPTTVNGALIGGSIGKASGGGIGGGTFRNGSAGNSLIGQVRDPSGAVIPNAQVMLRNNATGETQMVRANSAGNYDFTNVPAGPSELTISSPGFNPYSSRFNFIGGTRRTDASLRVGASAETVEVSAEAPGVSMADAISKLEEQQAEAEGENAGDLFRYDIKQRITIGKNQSALVPIINAPIDAEKVTLWSARGDSKRALRALWLKNTSDLTLDSGTFNVLDAQTFAGEGLVDTLKPSERRLVSYAADTAVRVTSEGSREIEPITRLRVARGVMTLTRGQRRTSTYKIHNADTDTRTVILEHPLEQGWKLAEDAKPEETSASFYRFRVPVEAGKTAELKVQENHPEQTTLALTNLTSEQVTLLFRGKTVPPALDEAFKRLAAKKYEINAVDQQIRVRQQEMDTISSDQTRVRENMKALKGSAEEKALLQRYAQQLNQQEDRLAVLRKEAGDLHAQRERLGSELDRMVQEVSLDEAM